MLSFENADFRPLAEFPLKWRWTDERWNKLPSTDLIEIQPFSPIKAHELNQYALQFLNQSGPDNSSFDMLERVNTSLAEEKQIQQWLFKCSSNLNQPVIVSWDSNLAALVKWKIFCKYWNDFCYPASDDVAIFPLSEEWILFHSHDEYFVFGSNDTEIKAILENAR